MRDKLHVLRYQIRLEWLKFGAEKSGPAGDQDPLVAEVNDGQDSESAADKQFTISWTPISPPEARAL